MWVGMNWYDTFWYTMLYLTLTCNDMIWYDSRCYAMDAWLLWYNHYDMIGYVTRSYDLTRHGHAQTKHSKPCYYVTFGNLTSDGMIRESCRLKLPGTAPATARALGAHGFLSPLLIFMLFSLYACTRMAVSKYARAHACNLVGVYACAQLYALHVCICVRVRVRVCVCVCIHIIVIFIIIIMIIHVNTNTHDNYKHKSMIDHTTSY